ncbi:AEC family transporter [Anaeromicrobium sediminis]|uniref:Malate transporter n=1 Tax=Anaeromicrobium sediminis TaxID=1478221 RepID=A0A267ME28_9FIRM|nr:AEC family transporter [Anaeromicrobium sediminis]PAB57125.1 malate transporter [Anaeromicrobium sediminis]
MILSAIESVLTIFVMIGLGVFLSHKKWFDRDTSKLFSKLVINISLPCLMFTNFLKNFNREMLLSSLGKVIVPYLTLFITYAIACIISKLLRIPERRRALFHCMFATSNTIFIGLPINIALFGEESVPYVLLYFFANTTVFWTFMVYSIRKSSGNIGSIFSKDTVKKILSPPLIAFFLSISFVLLDLRAPKFMMDSFKYIGNTTTALSMMFIGITIYNMDFKKFKLNKDVWALLGGRFLIAPAIVVLISMYVPLGSLMKKVFILEAAMPAMANTAIVAQRYDADYEYAAALISISTIFGLIFIPIYRVLLGTIS